MLLFVDELLELRGHSVPDWVCVYAKYNWTTQIDLYIYTYHKTPMETISYHRILSYKE